MTVHDPRLLLYMKDPELEKARTLTLMENRNLGCWSSTRDYLWCRNDIILGPWASRHGRVSSMYFTKVDAENVYLSICETRAHLSRNCANCPHIGWKVADKKDEMSDNQYAFCLCWLPCLPHIFVSCLITIIYISSSSPIDSGSSGRQCSHIATRQN